MIQKSMRTLLWNGRVKDEDNKESSDNEKPVAKKKAKKKKIVVNVNGKAVTLDSKSSYVFVDIFDKIDFDLSKPQGAIVTKKNGASAEYMEEIHDGDVIDVYWEKI